MPWTQTEYPTLAETVLRKVIGCGYWDVQLTARQSGYRDPTPEEASRGMGQQILTELTGEAYITIDGHIHVNQQELDYLTELANTE